MGRTGQNVALARRAGQQKHGRILCMEHFRAADQAIREAILARLWEVES